MEVVRAMTVRAAVASALVEREAREMVWRMEAESAASLVSTHGEAEVFTQRIALLESGLMEVCQDQDRAEANSHGLSNVVADAERR
jgi:hypothetical protein